MLTVAWQSSAATGPVQLRMLPVRPPTRLAGRLGVSLTVLNGETAQLDESPPKRHGRDGRGGAGMLVDGAEPLTFRECPELSQAGPPR
jgi:hypothetical protein